MSGKEKEKHCDFSGVAGALPVSPNQDPDDEQIVVGPRGWPWPYLSHAWVWVLELIMKGREISVPVSKRAGAMSMRETASRGDFRRRLELGEDSGSKRIQNEHSSSSSPCASVFVCPPLGLLPLPFSSP